jgi:alpha-mannosidase
MLAWLTMFAVIAGQTPGARPAPAATPQANLTTQPTLYVVGYAHLDTQWRWDYKQTIQEYLPKTLRENFALFEKYPHYVFNFSGANRYRMIKEYYPADFDTLKGYVAAGRWFPAGSSMEENDVNSPSAESTLRQILYGTGFFKREFGKTSAEYMLPDCFGFPASLPTILAHAGLKGFSTQKLSASWQPAPHVGGPDSPEQTPAGIPFNVGVWEGLDGSTIVAALNPGSYGGSVTYDLSKTPPLVPPRGNDPQAPPRPAGPDWPARIDVNGTLTGVYADYMYYGTGDTGGSPSESSVKLMEAIVTKSMTPIPPLPPQGRGRGRGGRGAAPEPGPPWPPDPVQVGDGPVRVIPATSEQLFEDLTPAMLARLPRYKGDLELINHSAGSLTSQAYVKRWNRQNEVLADDAERASVMADWLGGRPYPRQRLTDAWTLVMGAQFHDIIPGTSVPKAYEYAWNDQILAMNQFAGVLTSATEAVTAALDTETTGASIVVYNALNIAREDLVEATVDFPGGVPQAVRVVGPDGREVPAQVTGHGTVLFVASMPSVGYAVFGVQPANAPASSTLSVTETSLENARYRVQIDTHGDIASIFDKSLNRELLAAPARLEIKTDDPAQWPAWNMDYEDQMREPRAYVDGPATVRIVERGPARVALEVSRKAEESTFVQTIRLSAGDAGNRVEVANAVDWNTRASHLKAVFPLTASNPVATYNWDIGTIERSNDFDRQFEVPSHQWVDLTDRGGAFGVTLLTDSKNASDKPNDNTLRLTLVRTPGTRGGYTDQGTQDLGHHEFVYGLGAHASDFRQGGTDWQGWRLNQPLVAFASSKHPGVLGRSFSLVSVNNPRVRVLALKKAEEGQEVIVRIVELDGKHASDVRLAFASPLAAAREVNGVEAPVGSATVSQGALVTTLTPFQVRTFALTLGAAPAQVAPVASRPVPLPYNQSVTSHDRSVGEGRFDSAGRSLPAEMLPATLAYGTVRFNLAPAGGLNAVIPRAQEIALPDGPVDRVYLLAAADGDQSASFRVGDAMADLTIDSWTGYVGQWDNRIWTTREEPVPAGAGGRGGSGPVRMRTVQEMTGLTPGFVKRAPVAWFASHRHGTDGSNEAYDYSYLFVYAIDVPAGARSITLPMNERIRILAMSTVREGARTVPAQALYDTLEGR